MSNYNFNQLASCSNPSSLRGVSEEKKPSPIALGTGEVATDHVPLGLTLGIELEFLLAVSMYPDEAGPNNFNRGLGESLVRIALSKPLEVPCATCGQKVCFTLRLNYDYTANHKNWSVESDGSLYLNREEYATVGAHNLRYFHIFAVEMKSRVFRHDEPNNVSDHVEAPCGHPQSITYTQEIEAVLARVTKEFGPIKDPAEDCDYAWLLLNNTAGFHVHIGNERKGFPLRTVKNLVSSYLMNERAIDGLHSANRIGGSTLIHEPLTHPRQEMDEYQLKPAAYNSFTWSRQLTELTYRLRRFREGLEHTSTALPCEHVTGSL